MIGVRDLWLVVGAAVLSLACVPVSGAGRATVLPRGRGELSVTPEVMLATPRATNAKIPSAQLVFGYHRGFTERLELGARGWRTVVKQRGLEVNGAALDSKVQLRSRDAGASVDVALSPSASYHQFSLGGTPEHQLSLCVPLLVGWRVGQRNQVIVGPRLLYQIWFGESQVPQRLIFAGTSVGFAWQISQSWSLIPELMLLYSPVSFGGEDPTTRKRGLSILSLGVGVGYLW